MDSATSSVLSSPRNDSTRPVGTSYVRASGYKASAASLTALQNWPSPLAPAPPRLRNVARAWFPQRDRGQLRLAYHINTANKLVLESKQDMAKRGEASPDDADALALTFAQAVAPVKKAGPLVPIGGDFYCGGGGGWMAG